MSDINKDTDNSTKTQQTIAEDLKALTSAAEPATGEGLKYLTIPPKDYDLDINLDCKSN